MSIARQDKFGSTRGLLLAEALLCAVIIAAGLVAISRGLSGQLHAIGVLQQREQLLGLARSAMAEQEMRLLSGLGPTVGPGPIAFEAPDDSFGWTASAALVQGLPEDEPSLAHVKVRAQRLDGTGPSAEFEAVWPGEKVPAEWF